MVKNLIANSFYLKIVLLKMLILQCVSNYVLI